MRGLARDENAFTGGQAQWFSANHKMNLTINDVDPFILLLVQVARPAACAGKLENAHRALCVVRRDLAIIPFATESDMLAESVVPCGDAEARKHFLILHFFGSFQVLDGFV